MSFVHVIERVRGEFMEMPDLELTVTQAGRLWTLAPGDCRVIIDALVSAGFLRWTARETVVWTGRRLRARGLGSGGTFL